MYKNTQNSDIIKLDLTLQVIISSVLNIMDSKHCNKKGPAFYAGPFSYYLKSN